MMIRTEIQRNVVEIFNYEPSNTGSKTVFRIKIQKALFLKTTSAKKSKLDVQEELKNFEGSTLVIRFLFALLDIFWTENFATFSRLKASNMLRICLELFHNRVYTVKIINTKVGSTNKIRNYQSCMDSILGEEEYTVRTFFL